MCPIIIQGTLPLIEIRRFVAIKRPSADADMQPTADSDPPNLSTRFDISRRHTWKEGKSKTNNTQNIARIPLLSWTIGIRARFSCRPTFLELKCESQTSSQSELSRFDTQHIWRITTKVQCINRWVCTYLIMQAVLSRWRFLSKEKQVGTAFNSQRNKE